MAEKQKSCLFCRHCKLRFADDAQIVFEPSSAHLFHTACADLLLSSAGKRAVIEVRPTRFSDADGEASTADGGGDSSLKYELEKLRVTLDEALNEKTSLVDKCASLSEQISSLTALVDSQRKELDSLHGGRSERSEEEKDGPSASGSSVNGGEAGASADEKERWQAQIARAAAACDAETCQPRRLHDVLVRLSKMNGDGPPHDRRMFYTWLRWLPTVKADAQLADATWSAIASATHEAPASPRRRRAPRTPPLPRRSVAPYVTWEREKVENALAIADRSSRVYALLEKLASADFVDRVPRKWLRFRTWVPRFTGRHDEGVAKRVFHLIEMSRTTRGKKRPRSVPRRVEARRAAVRKAGGDRRSGVLSFGDASRLARRRGYSMLTRIGYKPASSSLSKRGDSRREPVALSDVKLGRNGSANGDHARSRSGRSRDSEERTSRYDRTRAMD